MLIAVDFDGTIVPDVFFPDKVPDRFMPGAKEALTELHRLGHTLVLWTLRDQHCGALIGTLLTAYTFLKDNGLDFIKLPSEIGYSPSRSPKFPADLYIDDKIPGGFQGWDYILRVLSGSNNAPGSIAFSLSAGRPKASLSPCALQWDLSCFGNWHR
ncbi:MAG TPA: hydrolase [Candidatus Ozemobacteraceae bacterium]|nr:hydrolase [Candidatus Ozemobacteraceae bacterium]